MTRDAAALLKTMVELPPLPAVSLRLMELASDERTNAQQLANVLSADPALTARILRFGNSAAYGYQRRVASVREAIMVVGFELVSQVAFATSMIDNFRRFRPGDEHFDTDTFWLHSVSVAIGGEAVARKCMFARPSDAFTAGILHDVGRLVLRQTFPREFDLAAVMSAGTHAAFRESELATMGYAHDDVGRALGEHWNFPEQIAEAIGNHHRSDLRLRTDGLSGIVACCARLAAFKAEVKVDDEASVPPDLAETEELCGGWSTVEAQASTLVEAISGGTNRGGDR